MSVYNTTAGHLKKMEKIAWAWRILEWLGLPLWAYAFITNFDTTKGLILFILGACTALVQLARYAIKMLRELITLDDDWATHLTKKVKQKTQNKVLTKITVIIACTVIVILFIYIYVNKK